MTRIYYFTFGSCDQLFEGGWVRIQADTLEDAQQKFIAYYGDKAWNNKGILNYAFDYPRDRFIFTRMFREGNFGKFEHEFIP